MIDEGLTNVFDFSTHPVIAGRYRFVSLLGKGGMGMVIKVNDSALDNEIVALKLLYPHLVEDRTVFSRFKNEVIVARKLAHPNIVRLYDFGRDERGAAYIVMEYVEGISLGKAIHESKEKLTFEDIVQYLFQICLGMQHAHSEGVVHRDIKPDNVLVTEEKHAKITDLGLARSLDVDKGFTTTGEAVGTPYYMAPETIRGDRPDPRSDVYSLGIMAFEMATGRRPFFDQTWIKLAHQHMLEPLPEFTGPARDYPDWFKNFVKTATEKKQEDRYQSFSEIIDVLQPYANQEFARTMGVTVCGISLEEKKEIKKNAFQIWLVKKIALTCLVFLLFGAGLALIRQSPAMQRSIGAFSFRAGIGQSIINSVLGSSFSFSNETLITQIKSGDIVGAKTSFAAGLSPNISVPEYSTLLHLAIRSNQPDSVQLLLQSSANAKILDSSGRSPLDYAIMTKNEAVTTQLVLVDKGSLLLLKDQEGKTPLMYAVEAYEPIIFGLVANNRSVINEKDNRGRTALHYAVLANNREAIIRLRDNQAIIDVEDNDGDTPLALAAKADNFDVAGLLISKGANKSKTLRNGKTLLTQGTISKEMRRYLLAR